MLSKAQPAKKKTSKLHYRLPGLIFDPEDGSNAIF
jgi:hypothetical protein